jgi:hypothetical protein
LTALVVSEPSKPVIRDSFGRIQRGSGRPRKRQGGGTLGNLNAVRNPWAVYWKRRALRAEDRWVLRLVEDYVPQLVADRGGESECSYAQMKVIELAAVSRVCWALAMARGDLDAVARFVGSERAALSDLGLERKAKPAPTLAQYLESKRAAEAEAAP